MKKENNNIPEGYKDSPLGIIPKEWEVKSIKNLGRVITGNTPPTAQKHNYGSNYMFVSPIDLSIDSKYIFSTKKMLSKKGFSVSRKLPKGSILFTCIGSTIGKCGIATKELTANQQINAIICNNQHNNEFLYYELNFYSRKIKPLAGKQAVPIINKSDFEHIKILIPPISEQKKIAEILSTWDIAIDKQTRIINLLEKRKQGLMQQLLTGKKRLKGFNEEWRKEKAGAIFNSISVKGNKNEVLLSATQENGVLPRDMLKTRVTMPMIGNTKSFKLVKEGDFVISLRSFQGGIEYSHYRGIVSPAYTVLIPKIDIDKSFYKYYFKSTDFIGHLAIAVIGIRDGKQISYQDFCILKIPHPSYIEQIAISKCLLAADSEIKLAKQILETKCQQKKGLMQILLTGRKRIKLNDN